MQLSLNVFLVMDCVTAWCGSQVQATKMTLARQRVLSNSEIKTSDLEHRGSWVRIPSGAYIFSVSSYWWFFTSRFISFTMLIVENNQSTTGKRFSFHYQTQREFFKYWRHEEKSHKCQIWFLFWWKPRTNAFKHLHSNWLLLKRSLTKKCKL